MKNSRKVLLPSTVAALATIFVPAITGLVGFFVGPSMLANGTPDNAPYRASLVLLYLLPPIFLGSLLAWYALSKVLTACNMMSGKALLLICLIFSGILGGIFALDAYRSFGSADAAISFFVFFGYGLVCLGLGAIGWWLVGLRWHNNSIKATG